MCFYPIFYAGRMDGKDVSWRQKNDKSSDFSAKSCEKEERKDKKEPGLTGFLRIAYTSSIK